MQDGDSESDMNYSDDEEISINDYYNISYHNGEDCDIEPVDMSKTDPEYFAYECLSVEEVERLLNESVETLSNSLQVCSNNLVKCSCGLRGVYMSKYVDSKTIPSS